MCDFRWNENNKVKMENKWREVPGKMLTILFRGGGAPIRRWGKLIFYIKSDFKLCPTIPEGASYIPPPPHVYTLMLWLIIYLGTWELIFHVVEILCIYSITRRVAQNLYARTYVMLSVVADSSCEHKENFKVPQEFATMLMINYAYFGTFLFG